MTREEIELVLSDLCNRTKYRPVVHVEIVDDYKSIIDTYDWPLLEVSYFDDKLILSPGPNWNKHRVVKLGYNNDIIKPYLRSLSSMTDEEWEDFEEKTKFNYYPGHVKYKDIPVFDNDCTEFSTGPDTDHSYRQIKLEDIILCINWLESHYFDYQGLIERGLALEAPKGMYKIQKPN